LRHAKVFQQFFNGKFQPRMITISEAITKYLESIKLARSGNTANTYKNALNIFRKVLSEHWLEPEKTPITKLNEDMVPRLATYLKGFAPATESLYVQAVAGFYKFLAAERLTDINLPRLELLIKQRTRRPGIRLPQFPSEEIEVLLDRISYSSKSNTGIQGNAPSMAQSMVENNKTIVIKKGQKPKSMDKLSNQTLKIRLREARDHAFLLTLADTGLRVHEACKLRRGDIDWNEGRAIILGKGDKQAVVRFSTRAMHALKEYLSTRSELDGRSGRPLASLPLFARHDKGAGRKIKPITTTSGRNIVKERVKEYLGAELVGKITPHSFRHYFVTTVLKGSGNLKLAQELARHSNIQVTQRYAHLNNDELDKGYYEIFEESRRKTDE